MTGAQYMAFQCWIS